MSRCRVSIVAVVIVAAMSLTAAAQSQFSLFGGLSEKDYFLVDYATFNSVEPGMIRLEVYYQIYNAALNFYRKANLFTADYEISVNVYGKGDVLSDSFKETKRVQVRSESQAKSVYDYRTNQVVFELPSEKYEVKVILTDPNSDRTHEREFKVKLKYRDDKKPKLSDIQLVQAASEIDDESTKFDKGDFTLVPSVSHKYGSQDALKLMYYFEVYQGKSKSDSVYIETKLRHATKGMMYRDSLTSPMVEGVLRQFREISIDNLRPGEFRLEVALKEKGKRDRNIDERIKYFELVWAERSVLKHDYESVVNQLAIISQPRDLEILKSAETYEQRLAAFNAYWSVRDPSPGTPENENKTEFYRRIQVATENFSFLRTSGWRTDRGRIYVIYGEPDQVEDYPFSINQLPYQEWHYYRDARYRKFVFIDERGDGDFRLIYPYDGLGIEPEFYR